MGKKNSHCSFCGNPFEEAQPWPRQCSACQERSYVNPLPVAVVLVPVDKGLLMVRRAIEPRKGLLALPGGFINMGESWQQAGAREVMEETGLALDPDEIKDFRALSAPDGTVLIFGIAQPRSAASLTLLDSTDEALECLILEQSEELGFPLHTQVVREYFARLSQ
ncbi:MAG: NUDIX domain-containing protein [Ardenticatenales bacterium]|nr:NUDIX domain-containing protein [Ardenticatenales bacterium]